MTNVVHIEDMDNLNRILMHHLGHPAARDDDGRRVGLLDERDFSALERDLLRYCTRLRCQPVTWAHRDRQGYWIPEHTLIGRP